MLIIFCHSHLLFGQIIVRGIRGGSSSSVALKPVIDDTIQYVSPQGNDFNDGLSWGTSKLTVMAAYDALPSIAYKGGGTIYIAEGSSASSTPGCGIWIMGSTDPNYNNPRACWHLAKSVDFIGVADGTSSPNGHMPVANVVAGSTVDRNHPAVWLSGEGDSIRFRNLNFSSQTFRAVVLGEASNNNRTGSGQVTNVTFENVHAGASQVVNSGPGWDITGASYWIFLRDCGMSGTDNYNSGTGDLAPAVLMDGRTNTGVGLVFIDNSNISNGAIKVYQGGNNASLYVRNLTSESLNSPATVWFANNNSSVAVFANLENITTADPYYAAGNCNTITPGSGSTCDVENDLTNQPIENISVLGSSNVYGAMQLMGAGAVSKISPLAQQQDGIINSRVVGQEDSARRGFGPVAVRFTNLVSLPNSGSGITTGIAAPDGTSKAITYLPSSSSSTQFNLYSSTITPSVGDWFIGGMWMKANTTKGFSAGSHVAFIQVNGSTLTGRNSGGGRSYCQPNWAGNQEWMWAYCIAQVTAAASGSIQLGIEGDSTHSMSVYGPVLFRIPSGAVATNEAWEIAQSLQSYSSTCVVGTVCGLSGQTLHEDTLNVRLSTPAKSSSTCISGNIWADTTYVYVCTATNTIKRATLSSF
jgi:hypothetical protein